jgi:hypothetical protein
MCLSMHASRKINWFRFEVSIFLKVFLNLIDDAISMNSFDYSKRVFAFDNKNISRYSIVTFNAYC